MAATQFFLILEMKNQCHFLVVVIIRQQSAIKVKSYSSDESQSEILFQMVRKSGTSIESFTIPPHLTRIGRESFKKCKNLRTFEIPNNSKLQTIEELAFSDSSIERFTIPSQLFEIKEKWCMGTSKLTHIFVDKNNPRYSIYDDKLLIEKSLLTDSFDVLLFACRDIEKVTIPNFIKIIKSCSFYQCRKIRQFEIQSNSELQTIENNAFAISSIDNFKFSHHITFIGEYAFGLCYCLHRIEIPENSELQTIGDYAFTKSKIESFIIPSNVKNIGSLIFNDCLQLQIIYIEDNSKIENLQVFDHFVCQSEMQIMLMVPVNLIIVNNDILNENDNFSSDDYPDFL